MKRFHWIALTIFCLVFCSTFVLAQNAGENQTNPEIQNTPQPQITSAGTMGAGGADSALTQPSNIDDRSYANDPRFTVSVSSLAAPEKAKKAFEKGEEAARKGKLQFASDYFKKAIDEYPHYAVAWLELGRVRAKQSSFDDAQQCFRQAVTQEPKLLDGYLGLAYVAVQQQNWKGLAETTDNLVQLSPDSSAQYWFLNSAAYYNMGNLQHAESSVTRGLRLDTRHDVPQMEYLYGLILAGRKQYGPAADHVKDYLRLAPNAPDREAAVDILGAFQRAQMAASEPQ
jgi:tetratricopeptide (TPR) repeat protein